MNARLVQFVVLLLFSVAGALAQSTGRVLPSIDVWPRTLDEWQSEKASRPAGTFKQAYPELASSFDQMMARLKRIDDKYVGARKLTPELARQLVDELYVDAGNPEINSTAQFYLIDTTINFIAQGRGGQLSDEARDVLMSGFMEYVEAGGGIEKPSHEEAVAKTLYELGGDKADVRELADSLLADAFEWANEIESSSMKKSVAETCARFWGDEFWFDAYAAQLPPGSLPEELPEKYHDALMALQALVTVPAAAEEPLVLRQLQEAVDACGRPFSDKRLEQDLTARLLVAFRVLCNRRAALPKRAIERIDHELIVLARDRNRLAKSTHWELWVRAVLALGPKHVSDQLRATAQRATEGPHAKLVPESARGKLQLLFRESSTREKKQQKDKN